MDKLKAFLQTSEGWAALIAAVLGVLVTNGIISEAMAKVALDIITALLTIIIARVVPKIVTPGEVPFVPNGGPK